MFGSFNKNIGHNGVGCPPPEFLGFVSHPEILPSPSGGAGVTRNFLERHSHVYNFINRRKMSGFTLAEVLITLAIIGVVASMTLPTLITKTQNAELTTSLKKAYTQMNQVLLEMAQESGENDTIASYFANGSSDWLTSIKSHYKIVKDCGFTQDDDCFAKFDDNYDGSAHSTSVWDDYAKTRYKFITADGMSFGISSYSDGCTTNDSFVEAINAPTNHTCGSLFVDVNGKKKPNCYGRDVFLFFITSNKAPLLYPIGGFYFSDSNTGTLSSGGDGWWNYNNQNYCSSPNKNGYFCAARIIEKGWQMDY